MKNFALYLLERLALFAAGVAWVAYHRCTDAVRALARKRLDPDGKLAAARYHEAWMLSTVRKAVRELNEAEVRAAIAEVDEAKKTGENVYLKTGLLKARKRLAEANGTSTPPPSDEQGLAGSAPGI